MKKLYIWGALTAFAVLDLSCSAALQRRYDQRHGTSSAATPASDRSSRSYDTDGNATSGDPTYRKDYDRAADINGGNGTTISGNADYNRQLLNQYAEMDKLGEVVLYELDILETRYNNLLAEYRTAKPSQRQVMSMDLDKISDDRLVLYKAYTNIYRNGKSDWGTVRKDVENTLRTVRKTN